MNEIEIEAVIRPINFQLNFVMTQFQSSLIVLYTSIKNPKNINSGILVSEALDILENNSITQLVVVDKNEYKGILHLHDILKEGIV